VSDVKRRLPWIVASGVISGLTALVVSAVWMSLEWGRVDWQGAATVAVAIGVVQALILPNLPKWNR
jgi:hypothetical protein